MPRHLPSLETLRLFEAAARHQSYTRAGEELGLTHAAVSQRLAALRTLVGYPLFVRDGRRMVPTPEARRLLPGTRQALQLADSIYGQRGRRAPAGARPLALSATPSFASRWLAPRLGQFAAAHPEIELELRPSADVIDLRRTGVDVAVRYGPGQWPGLSWVHLADETVFPVTSPAYQRRLRLRRPQDLSRAVLIRHHLQPWEPWLHEARCELARPPSGPLVTDTGLTLDIAAAGGGVALGRQLLAEADLRAGRLVRLFDVSIPDTYAYHLVWLPQSPMADAIAKFRRWLQGELRATGRRRRDSP